MKPLGFKNYGSIPHLSNSKLGEKDYHITEGQERILTIKPRDKHDNILVFEKYDGSNVGVAKVNGEIIGLTRSGYLAKESNYKVHHDFHNWLEKNKSRFNFLSDGERLVGEWMMKRNTIEYAISTKDPILFFDWFDAGNNRLPYSELYYNTTINTPRLIHSGFSASVDSLINELNKKCSVFASLENPEGMVYRVERNGKVDFLAKWVRHDFEPGKYLDLELINYFV